MLGEMARSRCLALSLLLVPACFEDVCELDMSVSGSRFDEIHWDDASCSIEYDYETSDIVIEHEGRTLEIAVYGSSFAVGMHRAEALFIDSDSVSWNVYDCTVSLTEATLEPWTKNDHWILQGSMVCGPLYQDGSTLQLSDVQFSVYTAE